MWLRHMKTGNMHYNTAHFFMSIWWNFYTNPFEFFLGTTNLFYLLFAGTYQATGSLIPQFTQRHLGICPVYQRCKWLQLLCLTIVTVLFPVLTCLTCFQCLFQEMIVLVVFCKFLKVFFNFISLN